MQYSEILLPLSSWISCSRLQFLLSGVHHLPVGTMFLRLQFYAVEQDEDSTQFVLTLRCKFWGGGCRSKTCCKWI